jgi:hypothetical protein
VASGTAVLTVLAIVAAAVVVVNAVISLRRGVYDLRTRTGVGALVLDSTWNLIGTAMAVVIHAVNAVLKNSGYNDALSRGATYHVYDHGMTMRRRFSFTFGNVVTNGRGRADLVQHHEAVHVWQQRAFGPLYPLFYGLWFVGGAVVGAVVWLVHRDEPLFKLVEAAAYYDNPFEFWAYRHQGVWPPHRASTRLLWKVRSAGSTPDE